MEAARVEGNHERMRVLSEEGLKLSAEVGDKTNVAYCLEGLAAFAASEGRVVRAARLWGTAEALLEKIEATVYPYASDRSHYQREVDAARSQPEATAWEAAWSEGRAMTLEEAIEYALSDEEQPDPSQKEDKPGLSDRELEILRLVAQGLTDSQVAERLYVSPRTVGQHLRSIYRKLGVPTRAAAAKVAVERSLI